MNNAEEILFNKAAKVRKQLEELVPRLLEENKRRINWEIKNDTIVFYKTNLLGKQLIFERWCRLLADLQTKRLSKPKLRLIK